MNTTNQSYEKEHVARLETVDNDELPKVIDKALAAGHIVQMRSELDDLPSLQAYRVYWRITLICMLAAFSAALDGYRTFDTPLVMKLLIMH